MLKLLGWKFAEDGSKALPFEATFQLLGVSLNLSRFGSGFIEVSNTPSRIEDVCKSVDEIINTRNLSSHVASSLFGKMSFALGSVFGRGAAPSMRFLSNRASSCETRVSDQDVEKLISLKAFLQSSKPRVIDMNDTRPPVIIFTDAAEEGDLVTYGIVLIDGLEAFVSGGDVPEILVQSWRKDGSSNTISQAELFPVVLSKHYFKHRLFGRRVINFIDNEPAKFGLIRADSPCVSSNSLIKSFHDCESLFPSVTWFTRVPSSSNIADDPSRGKIVETAKFLNADVVLLHDFEQEFLVELNLPHGQC
jgi:hypothetical protein